MSIASRTQAPAPSHAPAPASASVPTPASIPAPASAPAITPAPAPSPAPASASGSGSGSGNPMGYRASIACLRCLRCPCCLRSPLCPRCTRRARHAPQVVHAARAAHAARAVPARTMRTLFIAYCVRAKYSSLGIAHVSCGHCSRDMLLLKCYGHSRIDHFEAQMLRPVKIAHVENAFLCCAVSFVGETCVVARLAVSVASRAEYAAHCGRSFFEINTAAIAEAQS